MNLMSKFLTFGSKIPSFHQPDSPQTVKLSDAVGLSDTVFDSLTAFDTVHGPRLSKTV